MQSEQLLKQVKLLNNKGDYKKALQMLDDIADSCSNNSYYSLRRGIALYELNREDEALPWFVNAQQKGLEDIDEMPNTYLPKKVSDWVQRTEKKLPNVLKKIISKQI